MGRLRKFLNLSASERRLLFETALLLGAIKAGMKLLPFKRLRRLVDDFSDPSRKSRRTSVEDVVWAVELAGRHMPGTCLTQAMAGQILLGRQGYPTKLHIGVVKESDDGFLAHAWLESGGDIVIGGGALERYTPLISLGREPS